MEHSIIDEPDLVKMTFLPGADSEDDFPIIAYLSPGIDLKKFSTLLGLVVANTNLD
jgi:hypothetical protein